MPKRPEVETWFASYESPMKDVLMRVRDIILAADPRIDESIRWQAPTFTFNGDFASIVPNVREHALLTFPLGDQIPGVHPRLETSGNGGRIMKFASVSDVEAARGDLERLTKAWCDSRASAVPSTPRPAVAAPMPAPAAAPAKPAAPKPAAKKPAKKVAKKPAKKVAKKPTKKAAKKPAKKVAKKPAKKVAKKPAKKIAKKPAKKAAKKPAKKAAKKAKKTAKKRR